MNYLPGDHRTTIDRLVEDVRNRTANLKLTISELRLNDNDLRAVLSDFPASAKADQYTRVNGLAVFPPLFNATAGRMINEILESAPAPLGVTGAGARILIDGLQPENPSEGFLGTVAQVMQYFERLAKASR